jgi:hypothetical protein
MELTVRYFENPGPQNTDITLRATLERARALGIRQIVVASSHGETARRAQALFGPAGIRVIAVSICHGFEADGWTMTPEERRAVEATGVVVLTGIHALGDDVNSAFSEKYGGHAPSEIVRETLYRFSQGTKVAIEVALMAADAGLLDMNQDVIAIAGTDSGADTALVLTPAYPRKFLDLRVREFIAKPR